MLYSTIIAYIGDVSVQTKSDEKAPVQIVPNAGTQNGLAFVVIYLL